MIFPDKKIEDIHRICNENKVKSLFAFGSITKGTMDDKSDIDLLVDIDISDPYEYTDTYFSLKEQLQELLGKNIDLLESRALHNRFLKDEIDKTKVLVYE